MAKLIRIGVSSFAKLYGFLGLLTGLFAGIMTFIISFSFGEENNMFAGLGLFIALLFPVIYGLLGIVGGFIVGLIINLFLKLTGGLEFEVKK